MALDLEALLKSMMSAAQGSVKSGWSAVRPFAQTQFKVIAQTIVSIEAQVALGELNEDDATSLLEMQKSASRTVLMAVEGISFSTAQSAINAALGAIGPFVNGALGFALV